MGMRTTLLTVAASLMFASAPAVCAAKEVVKLKITVIHATKKKGGVEASLRRFKRDLSTAFAGYGSFRRLTEREVMLTRGKKSTVRLPTGQAADFVYKGERKGRHQVNLSIPKSEVDVDLSAPFGRAFYQAGISYQGGVLILAMLLVQ